MDESLENVDDLEDRLRALIMKNGSSQSSTQEPSPTIEHARGISKGDAESLAATDQSLTSGNGEGSKTSSAGKSNDSNNKSGTSANTQHASQGRGRRPNQAQRRQMGTLDLQCPPSISTHGIRQSSNLNQLSAMNSTGQHPRQDKSRPLDASTPVQALRTHQRQPAPYLQHYQPTPFLQQRQPGPYQKHQFENVRIQAIHDLGIHESRLLLTLTTL